MLFSLEACWQATISKQWHSDSLMPTFGISLQYRKQQVALLDFTEHQWILCRYKDLVISELVKECRPGWSWQDMARGSTVQGTIAQLSAWSRDDTIRTGQCEKGKYDLIVFGVLFTSFYLKPLLPTASKNFLEVCWYEGLCSTGFLPTRLALYSILYPAYPLKKTLLHYLCATLHDDIHNLLVLVLLESSIFTFLCVRVTGFLPMGSLVEECWTPQELYGHSNESSTQAGMV